MEEPVSHVKFVMQQVHFSPMVIRLVVFNAKVQAIEFALNVMGKEI
jgi:hypothetical protein